MATTTFTVTHARAGDYQGASDMGARPAVSRIVNFLSGCSSGVYGATSLAVSETRASAAIILELAGPSVLVYIAGIELPEVDAGGTDELTAIAVAAAINDPANGVSAAVTAETNGSFVIVTANVPGVVGNFITLDASGTGVSVSSPRLTGGTTTTYEF